MGGVTAYHLRMLTENPWNGGGGFTWEQVGRMTLDQIFGRLCEMDILKYDVGKRVSVVRSLEAATSITPDADGMYKGRDQNGNLIKGRIQGRSKARMLMDAAKEKRDKEAAEKSQGKRRQRRRG